MPRTEHPIKGLLFDKDGTLFDFQTTWVPWAQNLITHLAPGDPQLEELIAAALGFDLVANEFRPESLFIAGTSEQMLDALIAVVPEMSRAALEQFSLDTAAKADLSPAVPLAPLLSQFKENGIAIGVATNDDEATARAHLAKAGVEALFDFIAGADSGFGAKPAPGMQLGFCAATGLGPEQVAMVGDSQHDLRAGQRAGMITIGVLTGVAGRQELAAQATVVLDHIGQIPDWLHLP